MILTANFALFMSFFFNRNELYARQSKLYTVWDITDRLKLLSLNIKNLAVREKGIMYIARVLEELYRAD